MELPEFLSFYYNIKVNSFAAGMETFPNYKNILKKSPVKEWQKWI